MNLSRAEERTLLQLIARSPADSCGWARASHLTLPLLKKLDPELIDLVRGTDGGGHARLTTKGKAALAGRPSH